MSVGFLSGWQTRSSDDCGTFVELQLTSCFSHLLLLLLHVLLLDRCKLVEGVIVHGPLVVAHRLVGVQPVQHVLVDHTVLGVGGCVGAVR